MDDCIFCRIVTGEAPAEIVYEDDRVIVFPDIEPSSPVHLLVVPKEHVPDLDTHADSKLTHHILQTAKRLGEEKSGDKGYRIAVNSEKLADVNHLHIHVLGGRSRQEISEGGELL